MKTPSYDFLRDAGRILNSGQSRTLVVTGNIYDLFCMETDDDRDDYVPLVEFLTQSWSLPGKIVVVYEINGPIRFVRAADRDYMKKAWLKWRTGLDETEVTIQRMFSDSKAAREADAIGTAFDVNLINAVGNPTLALELLRQMCMCSRMESGGKPVMKEELIILLEAADLVVPEAPITNLADADRHRMNICHDWFSDPEFANATDSVVLIAESRSLLHHRVGRLPQVLEVSVPSPDEEIRKHFISWFNRNLDKDDRLKLWSSQQDLAEFSAGLSIHALMQLLRGAAYYDEKLTQEAVIDKVESYIQSQLGEDIVEFKKPSHGLKDVVGFSDLKRFLEDEVIPRFQSSGPDALTGAAVAGPIGGGKTFIFEAVAAELDMVVLVLKSIRSQWFGQTDVIFERLKRVLDALAKVLIFVDEADTQFGGVGAETHATERRLTGKIQAMMSDPQARGRVAWLLMTARIHLLSPDIRRPGRVGDLIIPVLDPEGEDRDAFLQWVLDGVLPQPATEEEVAKFSGVTQGHSAAAFASLRSELKARAMRSGGALDMAGILDVAHDLIPPAIAETRRFQTVQALMNCTRRRLLPPDQRDPSCRDQWAAELRDLEARGIR